MWLAIYPGSEESSSFPASRDGRDVMRMLMHLAL